MQRELNACLAAIYSSGAVRVCSSRTLQGQACVSLGRVDHWILRFENLFHRRDGHFEHVIVGLGCGQLL